MSAILMSAAFVASIYALGALIGIILVWCFESRERSYLLLAAFIIISIAGGAIIISNSDREDQRTATQSASREGVR
ncbi:hypothetical protein [Aureimonas sp. N4]|uniref:hypothetical protein n=1 Tax=Aureimonas sp. N4 TaxID=1638165 RepID=UPI0012E3C78A|nr:hypothetical protein [Aureimonas sp. N4]